tara:strand:- start:154 stop:492 length:339 start_codon:yes stop_codon:yes gene_type:complete
MYLNKPWGHEEILCSNNYLFKRLFMQEGKRCSLQHHDDKQETVYILTGKLRVIIETAGFIIIEEKILLPNDWLTILPKTIHRMEAIEDTYYLEASTPHPDDVIRHKDDYNRI